jgi:hypothetical protein
MGHNRLVDTLLWVPAIIVVAADMLVCRPIHALFDRVWRINRLQRLNRRLATLPPGVALPLFLIPEAASRAGWLASAWLLLNGAAWEALAVYVLTKLLATVAALWVYRACEPALLRVAWFARCHAAIARRRKAMFPANSRFAITRSRVRLGQLP